MTLLERIVNIFAGVVVMLCGGIIIMQPKIGVEAATVIIGFSLLIYGIRTTLYYFRLARHMVGGKRMLYTGIIAIDFGAFTLALADAPRFYIVIYLISMYAFSGVIGVLRSLESKRMGASWKLNMAHAVSDLIITALCVVFIGKNGIFVWLYAAGLLSSGFVRIAKSFRKTAVVYIQ